MYLKPNESLATSINVKKIALSVVLLWVLVFLLTALAYYLQLHVSGSPRPFLALFFGSIEFLVFFVSITLVLVWHISTMADDRIISKKILKNWLYLSLLYMSVATVYQFIIQIFLRTPDLNWLESISKVSFVEHLFNFLFLQLAIGFSFVTNYIRQLSLAAVTQERLRADLAEVDLNLTKAQYSSHFLFNSLNAVSGLIRNERPTDALSALRMVRDMLRKVGRTNTSPLVPFEQEWSFLQTYLSLQQLRFGQKLQLNVNIPEAMNDIMWPRLTLQPLLENAIHYGTDLNGNIPIDIVGSIENGKVKVKIRNVVLENQRSEVATGLGQGHDLVKKRLAMIASKHAMLLQQRDDQYYTAIIELNA